MSELRVTIAGAGIFGLWQALFLARAGHDVRVLDEAPVPFARSASQYAGAMIAPYCEAEAAEPLVQDLGLHAARLWKAHYPGLIENGTLVVAGARDRAELRRFARMTVGHRTLDGAAIAELEADLGGRFEAGLFFGDEAHMITPDTLRDLLGLARQSGAVFHFGVAWDGKVPDDRDVVIDCRGMAATADLATLRGVRGERLIVETREVELARPVRLLHPRHPLYVVPWSEGRFLIGATVIETDDKRAITVRSALELLGLAYALHPAFGEAEIIDVGSGVRPSFPDNVPRVIAESGAKIIRVNGAFRHGFLLGPVMAEVVAGALESDQFSHPLLVDRRG